MSDPTPEQLAQAATDLRNSAPPGVSPPSEAEVAAGLAAKQAAGPQGVTDVDVAKLFAMIGAQQKQLDQLLAERAASSSEPVLNNAVSLRDLIAVHATHTPGTDHSAVLRLADDAVDAARNAAGSGDGSLVTQISQKIARALHKVHPGPGENHYFRQALGLAEVHLPDSAAELVAPVVPAVALTSGRSPATVVAGSVTG